MVDAADGFRIACRCCGEKFNSRGWPFCTKECARQFHDRAAGLAAAAEVGHEVRKGRACEICGKRIPRYTKTGKATSAKVRWCGPAHRKIVLEKSESDPDTAKGRNARFDPSESPILQGSAEASHEDRQGRRDEVSF
jgi:hypothetical protein